MQVTPEQLQSWLHPGNRRTEWGPDEKGNFSPFLIPPIVIPPWKNLKTRDSVEVEGEKLWLFWGDIHGHSGLSDGRRTLDEFYAFARKIARLDFAAHTPHDSNTPYDYCTDAKWSLNLETAMMHNDPGEFITLPGYEWSHKWSKHPQKLRYGHCNIYSLEENFPLFRCENPNSDTPKKLLNNLVPCSDRFFCNIETSTSRGPTFCFTAKAAAVPAACPKAIQIGITLVEPFASWVVDMHLPATRRLSIFFGTKHL